MPPLLNKTAGDSLLCHTHTNTHTQAHIISICHLNCWKVFRSIDFILQDVAFVSEKVNSKERAIVICNRPLFKYKVTFS